MVNSKKVLALLVSIFVYINIYIPLNDSNKKEISKLSLYKSKLEKEKAFLENKKMLSDFIDQSENNLKKNEDLMHPSKMQDSIIFNKMQTQIKTLAARHSAKVVNVIWGEPYVEENSAYYNMPFTFIVEIEPEDTSRFFNDLFKSSKAITIKQAFFVKKINSIVVNMQVYLYKNGSIK